MKPLPLTHIFDDINIKKRLHYHSNKLDWADLNQTRITKKAFTHIPWVNTADIQHYVPTRMLAFHICFSSPANLLANTLRPLQLTLCNNSISHSCLLPLQSSQTDLRVQVSSSCSMGMQHALLPACNVSTTTHHGFVLPHLPTHVHLLLPPHQPCLVCPVFSLPTSPGGTLAKSLAETLRGCCWVWKTGGGLSWCERVKPPKVRHVDW